MDTYNTVQCALSNYTSIHKRSLLFLFFKTRKKRGGERILVSPDRGVPLHLQ